ncbi:MAG: DUF1624 domain-containing protein [Deltaproteobacteria bacterium]|nr:DUF1624 domain-containing protein [Deltaproteobacteria bacterium]
MKAPRIVGVDVARALASLIMLQGHAFHGWANDAAKETGAYAFTRVLGTFPLPAFLVLAGAAIALRLDVAHRRSESVSELRRGLARRGLKVLGYGYLLSLGYALIDGGLRWTVLLRADVLHVIGLSIALAAWVGIREGSDGRVDRDAFARRVGLLGLAVTLACPWLSALSQGTEGPARFVVGLVSDVPGVGLMPLVPLFAWLGLGAVAMRVIGPRLAEPKIAATLLVVALALLFIGRFGTPPLRDLGPGTGRASLGIVTNVLQLGGCGLVVLALGGLIGDRLSGAPLRLAIRIGQGSLFIYAIHIPFCYGRLAGDLRRGLDMGRATLAVLLLIAASILALALRDRIRTWARSRWTARRATA